MKSSDAMKTGPVAETLRAVGSGHCTSPLQPKVPSVLSLADAGALGQDAQGKRYDCMNGASTLNLDDFYKWWQLLRRGDEIVPLLKNFIPAELGYASDWAYCMQRDNKGIIRVRYWGVALDAMSSQQLLGKDYLAAHVEEDAALLAEHHDYICSIPCGGYVERTMLTIDGRELKFRHIDLPLASRDGRVDHLCGISDVMEEYAPSRTRLKDKVENRFGKFRYFDLSAGPKIAEWEAEEKI